MLPGSVAMFAIGFAVGKLTYRFGAKSLVIVGSIVSMVPFAWLAFSSRWIWEFIVAGSINGLGIGLAYASMSSLVIVAVPKTHTGIATAMNTNVRTIGGSIGTQLVAAILTAGVVGRELPREHGYAISFAMLALTFLLAGLAAMLIPVARSVEPVGDRVVSLLKRASNDAAVRELSSTMQVPSLAALQSCAGARVGRAATEESGPL